MGLAWRSVQGRKWLGLHILVIAIMLATFVRMSVAQTTGSVDGKVTDANGAAVGGAIVTITAKATGRAIGASTTPAGTYTSGALAPGDYTIKVEAKNFKTAEASVAVQPGASSSANFKLEPPAVLLNIEQARVERLLSGPEIDKLPINGWAPWPRTAHRAGSHRHNRRNRRRPHSECCAGSDRRVFNPAVTA